MSEREREKSDDITASSMKKKIGTNSLMDIRFRYIYERPPPLAVVGFNKTPISSECAYVLRESHCTYTYIYLVRSFYEFMIKNNKYFLFLSSLVCAAIKKRTKKTQMPNYCREKNKLKSGKTIPYLVASVYLLTFLKFQFASIKHKQNTEIC